MSTKEQTVRDAAAKLYAAIVAARKEGLVVTWPVSAEALPAIAVSETDQPLPAARIVVVAEGVEPGTTEANKVEKAAQKAVDAVVSTDTKK